MRRDLDPRGAGLAAPPALEVRHVAKSFGRRAVLTDATLEVRPGEIIAVVGENGAGKTTLLKIIVGLLKPNRGDVAVRGRIGYCPQEPHLFDDLTVREHFRYFASAYGLTARRAGPSWEAEGDALLRRFRFDRHAGTLVSRLSGGSRQKLNLSLALLHAPTVLVLDEPYAAFDWETYLHFWQFADERRARGTSILIVSHFMYDPSKCDRIYELENGTLRCG